MFIFRGEETAPQSMVEGKLFCVFVVLVKQKEFVEGERGPRVFMGASVVVEH